MKEIEVSTIGEYLSVIKRRKIDYGANVSVQDIVFRGQSGDFPLIPKICRLKAKGGLLDIEKKMLHEFKRSNPLLIQPHGAMDDWDYLTLGQHFGLPTRLLDWSNNALTALWFAVSSTIEGASHPDTYGVVWMLLATESDFATNMNEISPFDVNETKIFQDTKSTIEFLKKWCCNNK